MRVVPRAKAMQIITAHGRDFRNAKRQVAERITDAAQSAHTRAYWRAVLIFVQLVETGRSVDDTRHVEKALQTALAHRPRKNPR
jgi:hypothetical protein